MDYYNENDPKVAQWLRTLISRGVGCFGWPTPAAGSGGAAEYNEAEGYWQHLGPQDAGRCGWLAEAARQLQAIANLPPGWDSYGALPPDIDKLKAGWRLLLRLCRVGDLPKPHINPTLAGGVQFEWEKGLRYFEIEVADDVCYFWSDPRGEAEGTIADGGPLDAIVDYVRRCVGE